MISPEDVDLLHVTDEVAEAVGLMRDCWERHCAEETHEPERPTPSSGEIGTQSLHPRRRDLA
jgi:hypothetical protein